MQDDVQGKTLADTQRTAAETEELRTIFPFIDHLCSFQLWDTVPYHRYCGLVFRPLYSSCISLQFLDWLLLARLHSDEEVSQDAENGEKSSHTRQNEPREAARSLDDLVEYVLHVKVIGRLLSKNCSDDLHAGL